MPIAYTVACRLVPARCKSACRIQAIPSLRHMGQSAADAELDCDPEVRADWGDAVRSASMPYYDGESHQVYDGLSHMVIGSIKLIRVNTAASRLHVVWLSRRTRALS